MWLADVDLFEKAMGNIGYPINRKKIVEKGMAYLNRRQGFLTMTKEELKEKNLCS